MSRADDIVDNVLWQRANAAQHAFERAHDAHWRGLFPRGYVRPETEPRQFARQLENLGIDLMEIAAEFRKGNQTHAGMLLEQHRQRIDYYRRYWRGEKV